MRVAMYYNNRDVRIEEMQSPHIGTGELLVKVRASGICGSDVMEWYRIKKAPLVLGHEIAGEIVAIGEGVKCFKVGDRVTVAHHVPCNTCHYCLNGHYSVCDTLRTTNFFPGGFSDTFVSPRSTLIEAPLSCRTKSLLKRVPLQNLWPAPFLDRRGQTSVRDRACSSSAAAFPDYFISSWPAHWEQAVSMRWTLMTIA